MYQPAEDSLLLVSVVEKSVRGKSFLDIGAGSGIQSEFARKGGSASVLAVDIDAECVRLLKKKEISVVQSDLFSHVSGVFDVIAFNPPYLPLDVREDAESQRATTGGKRGDEIIVHFLRQAPKHLAEKGVILLVVSSLTPKKRILALLKKQKMKQKIVASQKLFFEKLEVWEITKGN